MLRSSLPHLYSRLLESEILDLTVNETKATCQNCLRSRDKRFEYLYKADHKCCTFFPFLPNFAVGGILKKKLEGESVVKAKISESRYALPIGLYPDLKYQHDFQSKKTTDFGRRTELLCPYFDKAQLNCRIWEFRGTVCTTFFCRSDYGKTGLEFWNSMSDYLSYVEMALAEECLVMLDFSPRDISDQLVFMNKKDFTAIEKSKTKLSSVEMKKYWNGYTDLENFYLMCYSLVENMSKKEFKEVLGRKGIILKEDLQLRYKKLK
jgi:Fe-S-cluster containining protein